MLIIVGNRDTNNGTQEMENKSPELWLKVRVSIISQLLTNQFYFMKLNEKCENGKVSHLSRNRLLDFKTIISKTTPGKPVKFVITYSTTTNLVREK